MNWAFVLAAAAGVFGIWVLLVLNRYARLKNLVFESMSDIDVALQRRHDLVPNLLATVKGYAAHERSTMEAVIASRNRAMLEFGTIHQQASAEGALTVALGRFLTRVEQYPELHANEQFLNLQAQLADTEDRIAAARRFYNANVRDHNIFIESFPGNVFLTHCAPADYFEGDESLAQDPLRLD